MENGHRQGSEREELDGGAEGDAHGRADWAASLERNEREDHQRGHERVALAVLQCQEHLEVQECERDGRLALRQESVQRVPQQQPVEQSPAQKSEREGQISEGREQHSEGRAVFVEVEVLFRVGRVQIPTGEQVETRRPKNAHVVRMAEYGLLNRHEGRARDVQREHEQAGPGEGFHHPPRDRVPNLRRDRGGLREGNGSGCGS